MTAEEPVARITISVGDSLPTQSAVGPLFNGSVVDAPADGPTVQGVYQLANDDLGRYLAHDGSNAVTSADGDDPATQWRVISDGEFVYFQSVANDQFLDADERALTYNVDINPDLADTDGQWELVDFGDGTTLIRNVEFGRYLDADTRASNVKTTTVPAVNGAQWNLVQVDG